MLADFVVAHPDSDNRLTLHVSGDPKKLPLSAIVGSVQKSMPELLSELGGGVDRIEVQKEFGCARIDVYLDVSLTEDGGVILATALNQVFRNTPNVGGSPFRQESAGTFRKPVSRKELIDEVRECLGKASGRLAEAESVHVQIVDAAQELLSSLKDVALPREALKAFVELREVLKQERPEPKRGES